MANTSDGKGDPPDPPNAYLNTDTLSLDSSPVHRANNDSFPTEIDQDLPCNSNHRPHISARSSNQDQNESPIFNHRTPSSPDCPITATTAHSANIDSPDIDEEIDFYEADTDFEPAPARTDSDTVGITDSAINSPDVETPGSPTLIDRLQYATNSKWDNSSLCQVSYRKKHKSHAIDHNNTDISECTANATVPGYSSLPPHKHTAYNASNNFDALGPRDSTGTPLITNTTTTPNTPNSFAARVQNDVTATPSATDGCMDTDAKNPDQTTNDNTTDN